MCDLQVLKLSSWICWYRLLTHLFPWGSVRSNKQSQGSGGESRRGQVGWDKTRNERITALTVRKCHSVITIINGGRAHTGWWARGLLCVSPGVSVAMNEHSHHCSDYKNPNNDRGHNCNICSPALLRPFCCGSLTHCRRWGGDRKHIQAITAQQLTGDHWYYWIKYVKISKKGNILSWVFVAMGSTSSA